MKLVSSKRHRKEQDSGRAFEVLAKIPTSCESTVQTTSQNIHRGEKGNREVKADFLPAGLMETHPTLEQNN